MPPALGEPVSDSASVPGSESSHRRASSLRQLPRGLCGRCRGAALGGSAARGPHHSARAARRPRPIMTIMTDSAQAVTLKLEFSSLPRPP